MKEKPECKMCETKFKVDEIFEQLFCKRCEYYTDDKL